MNTLKEKFKNIYFVTGLAYAGKSTIVKNLAAKYDGVLCEENYHDNYPEELDAAEFPAIQHQIVDPLDRWLQAGRSLHRAAGSLRHNGRIVSENLRAADRAFIFL